MIVETAEEIYTQNKDSCPGDSYYVVPMLSSAMISIMVMGTAAIMSTLLLSMTVFYLHKRRKSRHMLIATDQKNYSSIGTTHLHQLDPEPMVVYWKDNHNQRQSSPHQDTQRSSLNTETLSHLQQTDYTDSDSDYLADQSGTECSDGDRCTILSQSTRIVIDVVDTTSYYKLTPELSCTDGCTDVEDFSDMEFSWDHPFRS